MMAGMYPQSFEGAHSERSFVLEALPRSESMDMSNDPRFFTTNVIGKRLTAFKVISVVSTLVLNLAAGQMFMLAQNLNIRALHGVVALMGFMIMASVFLMNLFTVVVLVQQLFLTYRLLTAGPLGFEVAKSYYLNPNIVSMRHTAVKFFYSSLPLFVASSCFMVFQQFDVSGSWPLAVPICVLLAFASVVFYLVNRIHSQVFKESYMLSKAHEQPLMSHIQAVTARSSSLFGLDV